MWSSPIRRLSAFYTTGGFPNAWGGQLVAAPSRFSAADPPAGPAPPSELGVGGGRGRRPSAPDRPALLTSRPGQRDILLPAGLPWQREGGRRQVRL